MQKIKKGIVPPDKRKYIENPKMNEFIIYSMYHSEDDIGGDEWEIHIELNGEIISKYGDYYHDKGSEKAIGFIDGYAYAKNWKEKKDYIIKYDNKIDENLL